MASVEIPKMRGRKSMTDRQVVAKLQATLEALCDAPCCFWACKGPSRPQSMQTCIRCWALRDLASVVRSLEARTNA